MPGVVARIDDNVERLVRAFKKQVEKSGILGELKKRAQYEKPSIRLKKKSISARKRRVKQMRRLGLLD